MEKTAFLSDQFEHPQIAVFGEWDTTNLGDHAIHEGVRTFYQSAGWVVESFSLGSLKAFSQANLEFKSHVVPLKSPVKRLLPFPQNLKRIVRGFRQYFLVLRLLPKLRKVKALSVGGGALLADNNLHFQQSLAALTLAAKILNKPIFCLGCSAEGEWSLAATRIIRRFLKRCDIVAARDEVTAKKIAELINKQIPVFGDFALQGDPVNRYSGKKQYALAINVAQLSFPWNENQKLYEQRTIALIDYIASSFADQDFKIVIFTTGNKEDSVIANRVYSSLRSTKNVKLFQSGSLKGLRDLLSASEVVIASRLHAAILAIAEKTPVIGLSAAPKVRNFLITLNLERFCFGLGEEINQPILGMLREKHPLTEQLHFIKSSAGWKIQSEILETIKRYNPQLSFQGSV